MTEITGIDVSKWQGSIDWQKIAGAGVRFAILRATIGSSYIDSCLDTYYQGATAVGIPVGFYHVVYPTISPTAQINNFLSAIAGKAHNLPLFLDVELNGSLTRAQVHSCVFKCVTLLHDGREPLIYTSAGFANEYLLGDCGVELWVANYTTAPQPWLPKWWTAYRLWQYSSHGKVNGIYGDVDLNRYNGDEVSFAAWTGLPVPVLPPTLEERLIALETEARAHGWNV